LTAPWPAFDVEPVRRYGSALADHKEVEVQASAIRVLGLVADLEERDLPES
jgi:hypothetical protein